MKKSKLILITTGIIIFLSALIGMSTGYIDLTPILAIITPKHVAFYAITPMLGVVDISGKRYTFEQLYDKVRKLNLLFGTGIVINKDYLRTEQVIDNNTSTYLFQIWDKAMQNTVGQFPLQKGVKDNNIFVATGLRIYIDNRASGSSVVNLQTYPNPFAFTTGTNTGNSTDLISVYNGKWNFKINETLYVPGLGTNEFLKVPETQKSSVSNFSQFNGNDFVDLDAWLLMSGRSDNQLTLEMKLPTGWAGAALTGQNIITFYFSGFTLQNGESTMPYLTGEKDLNLAINNAVNAGKILIVNGEYSPNPKFVGV